MSVCVCGACVHMRVCVSMADATPTMARIMGGAVKSVPLVVYHIDKASLSM